MTPAQREADRQMLALLYAERDGDGDGAVKASVIIDAGEQAAAALERLRRDRLVELLGPPGGPYSYRLTRAARACLDALPPRDANGGP